VRANLRLLKTGYTVIRCADADDVLVSLFKEGGGITAKIYRRRAT